MYEFELNGFTIMVKYDEKHGKHILSVDNGYYVVVNKKKSLDNAFEDLKKMLRAIKTEKAA